MSRPLTPARLDALLGDYDAAVRHPSRLSLATDSLWGAKAIARYLGISPDTVRRIEKHDPTAPIYRPAGRLLAFKSELAVWLRSR